MLGGPSLTINVRRRDECLLVLAAEATFQARGKGMGQQEGQQSVRVKYWHVTPSAQDRLTLKTLTSGQVIQVTPKPRVTQM